MSEVYEEILGGVAVRRLAPGNRHELICARLHEAVGGTVSNLPSTRLLKPRARVKLDGGVEVCPDLGLVTAATGKLWLAAEVVNSDDHRNDTVVKKQIYEDAKLPRLWMIDPRYDNLEVYHVTEYGLALKGILAKPEILTEKLLPDLQISIEWLFRS